MNKMEKNVSDAKTGRIEEACLRYGVGRNSMRQLASDAGAVVRLGKIYLVNYSKVDAYMDNLSGEG